MVQWVSLIEEQEEILGSFSKEEALHPIVLVPSANIL